MGMIAFALAMAFSAQGAETLQPSTAWSVDYAEYSCTLSRSFGTGEGLVRLEVKPQTGGDRLIIRLTSKDRKRFAGNGYAALEVGQGDPSDTLAAGYHSIDDPVQGRIAVIRTGRASLTPLAGARTLTVQMGDTRIALAVPQMRAALKGLADCERDLAGGWGFDLSTMATAPVPTGAPQRWITNADYPSEALRQSISGEAGLLIIVDAAGKPQRCAVTESSGSLMLDQTSCVLILRRGVFKPAIGTNGKPMTAPWATTFRWELPGRN